ncbi:MULTISPECIES: CaiF/GrlA family transcriptional regulator [Lelliottia]|uniref:CaiF/GrlA family transcriptional regulator n=1 Tax=Lelliottia aquatilis TaxID=2080838 RepID=A0ABX4ZWE1_9ENTR|nr:MULTISPECIES: CaiF/GrlA family transcriptional regulator [Lelliottia]POZ13786.1 hypothetical protein C3Z09_21350 [Lelliottia aquatilis]POZ15214.1 hypothetical protein C3708_22525 [Lelliottia sp. 7254-16]POZ18953.1 hypothetical protein C3712_22370 [Lelliottia aquatilis]POZ20521.1 hypothetical protein C3711_22575 [Lelliottia aquatilis]POZ30554.1 hypothetical protein C3710_22090 [Lelliottia aquatilis]
MNNLTTASGVTSASGPDELARDAANLPLWLRVAQWCMDMKGPVGRNAIARAFDIPQRQAADLMLYITGRRGDVVQARRQVTVRGGGIREATLEVLSIHVAAMPARGGASQKAPRRRRNTGAVPSALRDLALGRRRSGGVA